MRATIIRANALVEQLTGRRPRWFRTPVGLLSPRIPIAARLADLQLVAWTATARDGVRSTSVLRALHRLERALAPGAILVLHDGALGDDREPIAGALLGPLLDRMDAAGLRSVTLSELCLADAPRDAATDRQRDRTANDHAEHRAEGQAADRPRP